MTQGAILFLGGILMASTGQLLMKKGALLGQERTLLRSFLNPFTIAGYLLMLGSTVINTIALKTLPLHMTVTLAPLGYAVVVALSAVLLRERIERHHLAGMAVILAGIVIFNLSSL